MDPSTIISRFQQYLQINTSHPTPRYQQAADFILSQAQSLSLHCLSLEFVPSKPVVLIHWPGSDPNLPSILLNSHIDVVAADSEEWDYPPFDAHIDSMGRIFARGAQDMKSVGMQYLEAICRLKQSGFKPARSVYVSFVPDEEIGGHDGAVKFTESEVFKKLNVGVVLDEGIASQNESYKVFYAEKIGMSLVINASGEPGHGSVLYDNSATENLMKSIESIRRYRDSQFDLVKAGLKAEGEIVSVNIVYLKAGTPDPTTPTGFVMNLQPSKAEAGFDMRIPPTEDLESLKRRIAEEWAPASRNMTFEIIHYTVNVSAHEKSGRPILTAPPPEYDLWLALLKKAVRKARGKLSNPDIFPASSDARYYREQGVPAIGFSPMANTPLLLHGNNEFLSEDEYLKGIDMYASIIKTFTSFAPMARDEVSGDEM